MVGDYLYDIQAGRNAGMRTALVTHGRKWPFADQADLVFPSFEEIPDALHGWIAAGAEGAARANLSSPTVTDML